MRCDRTRPQYPQSTPPQSPPPPLTLHLPPRNPLSLLPSPHTISPHPLSTIILSPHPLPTTSSFLADRPQHTQPVGAALGLHGGFFGRRRFTFECRACGDVPSSVVRHDHLYDLRVATKGHRGVWRGGRADGRTGGRTGERGGRRGGKRGSCGGLHERGRPLVAVSRWQQQQQQ